MLADPVFLLDAHGQQPLMPLAAAPAEHLLRTGKARRCSHPTFTILQLTRAVAQPIRCPVLIGIAVHRRVVELFVLAAEAGSVRPLVYVVVDVAARRRHWHWQRRKRRRRQAGGRMLGLMLDVCAVIGALWRLLPLSHVVVLQTATLKRDYPGLARQFKQYLTDDQIHASIASCDGPAPDGVPLFLYQAFMDFTTHPTALAPLVVALPMEAIDRKVRLWQMATRDDELVDVPGIGVINGLTGILDLAFDGTDDLPLCLSLPIAAETTGITWVDVRVTPTGQLQSWPPSVVALLPLASLEGRLDVEVLEHRISY